MSIQRRRRTQTSTSDWSTSIPTQKSRILLLGMSYPDVHTQLAELRRNRCGKAAKDKEYNESMSGVQCVVELVKNKLLNEVDGRDLAR